MNVVNNKKKAIDDAKDKVARKQAEKEHTGDHDAEIIDEEEYALIRNLKELKQSYRDAFESHRQMKMDVMGVEHDMQMCKTRLVAAFEDYYESKYKHLMTTAADQVDESKAGETYDSQEHFDLLEADRLEQQHPDALAFYKARKNATRNIQQKPAGATAMRVAARGR